MNDLSGGNLCLKGVQETDEFLVPMALQAFADDLALQHVESGEQGGGAVALVVVRHRAAPTRLERKARLGAVESLNLAFFIDRQHNGMGGRIDVEPNHVLERVDEFRITGEFERADTMRLQPMGLSDALHRTQADAGRLGHHPSGPMRCLARRLGQGQIDHLADDILGQRRLSGFAGLVAQEPLNAILHDFFKFQPQGCQVPAAPGY